MNIKVECCVLADKQVSIRLDGNEVHLMPSKRESTIRDLESAIEAVIVDITAQLDEDNDNVDW